MVRTRCTRMLAPRVMSLSSSEAWVEINIYYKSVSHIPGCSRCNGTIGLQFTLKTWLRKHSNKSCKLICHYCLFLYKLSPPRALGHIDGNHNITVCLENCDVTEGLWSHSQCWGWWGCIFLYPACEPAAHQVLPPLAVQGVWYRASGLIDAASRSLWTKRKYSQNILWWITKVAYMYSYCYSIYISAALVTCIREIQCLCHIVCHGNTYQRHQERKLSLFDWRRHEIAFGENKEQHRL